MCLFFFLFVCSSHSDLTINKCACIYVCVYTPRHELRDGLLELKLKSIDGDVDGWRRSPPDETVIRFTVEYWKSRKKILFHGCLGVVIATTLQRRARQRAHEFIDVKSSARALDLTLRNRPIRSFLSSRLVFGVWFLLRERSNRPHDIFTWKII